MKLQTALKKVSLLKGEIKELSTQIQSANTWTVRKDPRDATKEMTVGMPRIPAKELLETLLKKKAELCALKGKICIANGPVQAIIAKLGEAKDTLTILKGMSGDNRDNVEAKRVYLPTGATDYVDEVVVHRASLDSAARGVLIAAEIREIQICEEALNHHNFVTVIPD